MLPLRLSNPPKASRLLCQAQTAQLVAKVKGDASLAAVALTEFHRRTAAGEFVVVFSLQGEWLVGTEGEIQSELAAFAAKNLARVRKY
jgi:hypothetical protein